MNEDNFCPICGHDFCICTDALKQCMKNKSYETCEYDYEDCLEKCMCIKEDTYEKIV